MKRKTTLITFTLLSGLAAVVTVFVLTRSDVRADPGILYVAPGGNCGGGIATPCYGGVQEAVENATDGDEIRVASGTYTDTCVRPRRDVTTTGVVTQVVYISKTITIRGGYTTTNWSFSSPITYPTTLDAGGQGRVFYITGDISPTIEGLRITGGRADGLGGDDYGLDVGGGVYLYRTATTLSDNTIISNTAYRGGGVGIYQSAAT